MSLPLLSDTFTDLRRQGNALNERNDCAVIAISAITNHSYDTIHTLFHHYGRRPRCGTQWRVTTQVCGHLQLKLIDVTRFYDPSSVRSIVPHLPSHGRFLIRTRSHLLAVTNSIAHDWSAMRKLYVKAVYKVTTEQESSVDVYAATPATNLRPTQNIQPNSIMSEKPTHIVHEISERLWDASKANLFTTNPTDRKRYISTFRAQVVAECQTHGIHKTTASVQVGKWLKGLSPASR